MLKSYCPNIEPQAAEQIKNVAALPWVAHVAVMPDAHFGMGCTVGSVIGMRDALAPSTVGVDIGCVDADTEFLGIRGWVPISQFREGDAVMQYLPDTGQCEWTEPTAYIVRPQTHFLSFKTKYGINQWLTPDHRVLGWRTVGRRRLYSKVVLPAADLAAEHTRLKLGARFEFETSATPVGIPGLDLPLTAAQIRVQVMVMADAHIDGRAAILRFKKTRKITRAKELLDAAGLAYTTGVSTDGVTWFRFKPPTPQKTYKAWWIASNEQLKIIAEECLYWDGNHTDNVFFTRDKASADFIQYAFMATGKRAVMRADKHKDGEIDYRVFAHTNTRVGLAGSPKSTVTTVPSKDGKAYCFTVPSGFLVMRREGQIFMTGNCGMAAAKLKLTNAEKLKLLDALPKLRHSFERSVPVGFNAHKTPWFEADMYKGGGSNEELSLASTVINHMGQAKDLRRPLSEGVVTKAMHQMGTLGGGNHFIELSLDTGGNLWVVLHSGSRNIGKELAEYHIGVARKLIHNEALPDPNLAVFLSGTPEMEAYRNDLYWAQRFAFLNRSVMLNLVLKDIKYALGKPAMESSVLMDEVVACHHNYVSEETHFGEQLFVTRKGAISAKPGEAGIIPGSMGTKSYIVEGLGDPESMNSASHGAGRRMSRGQARRTLTLEDFAKQTEGVECRKDAGVLDEAPAAYKDIDEVMENQKTLVKIKHVLKACLCVKG